MTSDAVPDFMSMTPLPWMRPSAISPDHGSRVQPAELLTGKTSMWPFRTTRGPGPFAPWNSLTMLGCPGWGVMSS